MVLYFHPKAFLFFKFNKFFIQAYYSLSVFTFSYFMSLLSDQDTF